MFISLVRFADLSPIRARRLIVANFTLVAGGEWLRKSKTPGKCKRLSTCTFSARRARDGVNMLRAAGLGRQPIIVISQHECY